MTKTDFAQRFWLLVVDGPDKGKGYTANADRIVIGTHESCDLVLGDNSVSRFHCEITTASGRPTIRDLESRNSTIVDGVSVLHAHLKSSSTIQIGRSQLRFDLGNEVVEIRLSERQEFGGLVGSSAAMRRVFATLERAAEGSSSLLLEGETGTGKEVAAESVHRAGERKRGPFVVVDCGAIPRDLLESELFGHERGAFTGAVAARPGAFEAASGGTIFLDEIGELTGDLQPKLLRVLERREAKRVGSNKYLPVDVRVVAATNRNLFADVNSRAFRPDLYYRLAVLSVRLPPLRERLDDLPLLVDNLLGKIGAGAKESAFMRGEEFLRDLRAHSWPGNVRELRNYLERCLTFRGKMPMSSGLRAGESDEAAVDPARGYHDQREQYLRAFERRYLEGLVRRHGGNLAAAAREAKLNRATVYRMLWRLGLK